jgi:hypothetical protein
MSEINLAFHEISKFKNLAGNLNLEPKYSDNSRTASDTESQIP